MVGSLLVSLTLLLGIVASSFLMLSSTVEVFWSASGRNFILHLLVPATNVLGDAGQGLQVLQSVQHQNKFMMTAGVVTSLKYVFYIINTFQFC